jgi:hypothetical protein
MDPRRGGAAVQAIFEHVTGRAGRDHVLDPDAR